jgi:hypothetical protein
MPNAHVAGAATGLPEPYDLASQIFPPQDLAAMSIEDLSKLSHLLIGLSSLLSASALMAPQGRAPRVTRMLEELSGLFVGAISDIGRAAEEHRPATVSEADWRGWLVIGHASYFAEPLSDIAARAASAAATERDLEAQPRRLS